MSLRRLRNSVFESVDREFESLRARQYQGVTVGSVTLFLWLSVLFCGSMPKCAEIGHGVINGSVVILKCYTQLKILGNIERLSFNP
jgi:hypothetical protein